MTEESVNDWIRADYGTDILGLYCRFKLQLEEASKLVSKKILTDLGRGKLPKKENVERIINWKPIFKKEMIPEIDISEESQPTSDLQSTSQFISSIQPDDEPYRQMTFHGLTQQENHGTVEDIQYQPDISDISDDESSSSNGDVDETGEYTCSQIQTTEEPDRPMKFHGVTKEDYCAHVKAKRKQMKKDIKAEKKYQKKLLKLYNVKKNSPKANVIREEISNDLFF